MTYLCTLSTCPRIQQTKDNKTVEVFANYEPKMHYMTEWLKQLYGESEGKEQEGIFPAGIDLTTEPAKK